MKRLLLLTLLAVSACAPTAVDIPATAAVAIRLTDEAMPTSTAAPTLTPIPSQTPTIAPTPSLGIGSSDVRESDAMVVMYVPAGEFIMGYDQGRFDQVPAHSVYLDSYWIDQTEITVGMYDACARAGQCPESGSATAAQNTPIYNAPWQAANAYCAYVGARLPTEAEWEKAARGADERLYPWGMDLDKLKLTPFGGEGTLPPVGSVPDGASPYGALDMAGSAFEWVADWYSAMYYAQSPHDNPRGPDSGSEHVIRGGWWEWTKGSKVWSSINPPPKTVYLSTYRNGTGTYGHLLSGGREYYPGAGFRCATQSN